MFKAGSSKVIKSGANTFVWHDKWLPQGTLRSLIQGPLTLEDHSMLVKDLFNSLHDWNLEALSMALPQDLSQRISAIPRQNYNPTPDTIRWGPSINGSFSFKSAYSLAFLQKYPDPTASNLSWIWSLHVLTKIKHFLWLLAQQRIPTKQHLFDRHIIPDTSCPFCNHFLEDADHVVRGCPRALEFRDKIQPSFFHHPWIPFNILLLQNCENSSPSLYGSISWNVILAFSCCVLWNNRNKFLSEPIRAWKFPYIQALNLAAEFVAIDPSRSPLPLPKSQALIG